jgi:hypothetical protein
LALVGADVDTDPGVVDAYDIADALGEVLVFARISFSPCPLR